MPNYFYKGQKLPHWQPPEGTFFITARLYGSIPKQIIDKLKTDFQLALHEIAKADYRPELPADLLPEEFLQAIQRIRHKKSYNSSLRYWGQIDAFLDSNLTAPHWLRQPDVARLNLDNIHHYAERYFTLWACTIMSNHIHLLLTLNPGAPILWKVLQDMKKYSATQSNKLLNRSGHFWEHESYDHLVRRGEFDRILKYILNNPVKAGIVQSWTDHPWTFCHTTCL